MRLESLSIFSLLVFVLSAVNNVCFASEGGFGSLSSVSYVHDNHQRLAALTAYKKKINEANKNIQTLKKLLSKITQAQNDSYLSGFGFDAGFKTTRGSERRKDNIEISSTGKGISGLSGVMDDEELEKKLADVVVSLLEEQTKFMSLLLKRMIIFWNPSFNFGVDISSKGTIERGFLDMVGLGGKEIWSGSNYGGKLARATESRSRDQESLEKLIDVTEFYRYSMVYNYIHIIGPIYRHTKNFERTVRSRLKLFRNMRERLISSRDSLALMINMDLPDDIDLPYPIPPPCYLNVGENCNNEVYNQILSEVTFFKEVQDENKELSARIREEPCDNHESAGCTCCEIKKVRVSLIEWAFVDVQMDLLRLERDLKLCLDSIQQNGGKGDFSPGSGLMKVEDDVGARSFEMERLQGGSFRDDPRPGVSGVSSRSSDDDTRRSATGRLNRRDSSTSGGAPDIKRYKKRSFLQKTSRRISKRKNLKSRRTRIGRRLNSIDPSHGDAEEHDAEKVETFPVTSASSSISLQDGSDLIESESESETSPETPHASGTPDHNLNCKASKIQQCDIKSPLTVSSPPNLAELTRRTYQKLPIIMPPTSTNLTKEIEADGGLHAAQTRARTARRRQDKARATQ